MNISKRILESTFQHEELRWCYHHGASGQQKQGWQKGNQLADTAQGSLNQFEGPVQKSPFYKAMLTSGIENTSNSYNNARSNMRARANMSGFGYNQPVEQGAESELGAREASSLAAVPRQAMMAATGPALQAAGETASMGKSFAGGANDLEQERQRNSLWNKLWGVETAAAQGAGMAAAGG